MLSPLKHAWRNLRLLIRARDNVLEAWTPKDFVREIIPVACLGRWMYVINAPAGVQQVMVTNGKNYPKSPISRQTLKPLLGNGLFVSEGELWQRQRKISSPVGHANRLQAYADVVIREGQAMLAEWRQREPGTELDISEAFTVLTADVICQLMFSYKLGDKVHVLGKAFQEYSATHGRMHLAELLGLPDWLPRPGMLRGRRAVKKFDEVIHAIIAASRDADGHIPDNLIQILVAYRDENGRPMDPRLIRDEVASIFLAGHETTALTVSWAFYLLELHPDVEHRLHAELDRVLGGRPPAFADVPALVFTRAIIDETLRLYPPVHVFSRQAVAADEICGQKIPAGSYITISSWVLHRHKLLWEDPDAFKPDRFLPENSDKIIPFSYIPFGAGSRVCLGKHLGLLESVLLLAMTAQSYRLRVREAFVVKPVGRMTLRPQGGLPMRITPRQPSAP